MKKKCACCNRFKCMKQNIIKVGSARRARSTFSNYPDANYSI